MYYTSYTDISTHQVFAIVGGVLGALFFISAIVAFFMGKIAQRKGYSRAGFTILTFFFMLIGIIVVLVLPDKNSQKKLEEAVTRTLHNKLDELDALLAAKKITKKEYDAARSKVLMGE